MTHNEQNISSRNAFARFMMGSVMIAYGTARLVRYPKSRRGQMLVVLGSMKAAEGATKFCPTKAMSSSMASSDMSQQMMSGSDSQNASAGAGATMNSGTQSEQMGGSIMQMVGNIVQTLTAGNASQSTGGTQSMNSGAGQNAAAANIAQTIGNVAQQMTSGTTAQTIGNIAQTVVPQVSQMMNDAASSNGSQNTAGTNNAGKQTSAMSGSSNTNANAKTKNSANSTSNGTKNTSANGNKSSKQAQQKQS